MPSPQSLSPFAQDVRRHDRDRFLLPLLAGPQAREDLFVLYAFNVEIARVRELVTEPMLGRIRLQWWRDVVTAAYDGGTGGGHPTAAALGEMIRRLSLPKDVFEQLFDARELDLDPSLPDDELALERYAEGTSATLQHLALRILGVRDHAAADQAARHVGIAWALTGVLRAYPYHASAGRLWLPFSVLDKHGIDVEDLLAGKPPTGLRDVARAVADLARCHLAQARALRKQIPKEAIPALLPATMAESYLRGLEKVGYDLCDLSWSRIRPRPLLLGWKKWRNRY